MKCQKRLDKNTMQINKPNENQQQKAISTCAYILLHGILEQFNFENMIRIMK